MCKETRPTSSHCSVDAGRDAAGGWWGENPWPVRCWWDGGFRLWRCSPSSQIPAGTHSCMGDLGGPPMDQGIGESSFESGWGRAGAFARASCRQKVAVSWLQRPPTWIVNTSLQRRVRRSSGYVCFSMATGRQLMNDCKLPPLSNILHTMSTTRWFGFSLAFNVLWVKCPCAHGDGSSSLPAPSKYAHYCVMLPPLRWVSNNLKFGYWRVKVGRIWRAKICLHNGHRFEKAAAIFSHVLRASYGCLQPKRAAFGRRSWSEWVTQCERQPSATWAQNRKSGRMRERADGSRAMTEQVNTWLIEWLSERQVLE